jgi:palmitoyl-protein thioesterase
VDQFFFQDSTVIPIHSQHFETYAPDNDTVIVPLRESKIYKEDWIGLKKLDETGRLVFIEVPGDHIEYDTTW